MGNDFRSDPFGDDGNGGKGPRRDGVRDVAERIMSDHRFVQTSAGRLHRYNGRHWEFVPDAAMHSMALRYDDRNRSTMSRRSNVASFIAATSYDEDFSWGRVADHELAMWDGIIDVRTVGSDSQAEIRAHDPQDWLEAVAPHSYAPDKEHQCPTFQEALLTWFDDDVRRHDALQEFFGYCLMSHAKLKTALLLIGDSNTGKSEVVWLLQQLVGQDKCCALPTHLMDDPKMRAVLVGARLNVITEVTTGAMIADGGFKTLVSAEDPVMIDEKYRHPYLYRPTAKHVIACNTLPRLNDRTNATFNRLLVIPMNNVIEKPDTKLRDKLTAEMEGIFAWAVTGAARLFRNNGKFTDLGPARDLLLEYLADDNPAVNFVRSELVPAAGSAIHLHDLVSEFNEFNKCRFDVRKFGGALRAGGFETATRRLNGRQAKALIGYRRRTQSDN